MTEEAEQWGHLAEAAVRARYDLDRDRCSFHDAVTADGRPVESKTCRVVLVNGRRGRWWIQRESHDQLVDADGLYALSIYDPQAVAEGPILGSVLVPASEVDNLVAWTANGRGHHRGTEHAKLGWPHVLSAEVVEC
jgi:hypothetical protein